MRATIGDIRVIRCATMPESCNRSARCPSRRLWQLVNDRITLVNTMFDTKLDRAGVKLRPHAKTHKCAEIARRHGARFGGSPAEALTARVRGLADDLWLVKPDGALSETGKYFSALWERGR